LQSLIATCKLFFTGPVVPDPCEWSPVMKIQELANPAAVAWRPDADHEICWVRGSRSLVMGTRVDGRWFTTPISNPSYDHDGTLKGAREAARRFIADAFTEDSE
jgi:hypothetical protein